MPRLELGKRKPLKRSTRSENPFSGRQREPESEPIQWHVLTIDEVVERLETDRKTGLRSEQIQKRLEQYGLNTLPTKPPPTLAMIFLHQFKSPLIYILLIAAMISISIGDAKDATFIFAILLLNATLGTFQEWKAEQGAAALQSLIKTEVHVLRNGEKQSASHEELVPGDVVYLESGSRVPADLRLAEANNLAMDEALLTGESVPVDKTIDPLPQADIPIGDRRNMAYAGSLVVKGRGTGIVIKTGLKTEMGQIAESVSETEISKTPLLIRMEQFTRRVAFVILGSSVIIGIFSVVRGLPIIDALFLAIALAVSAIPEGLPVAMTVALSIATQRMAKRNVIVRKLPAVEGLGSCTYIVSDKTGTLTINKQTLRQVVFPEGKRFLVTGEGYSGEGTVESEDKRAIAQEEQTRLIQLARAGMICNEGDLTYRIPENQWVHQGDAVDVTILAFGYKLGLEPQAIRKSVQIIGMIPYESERGYAATFYRENAHVKAAVKGAGERVLPFCRYMTTKEGAREIDAAAMEQQAQALAESGYRVLVIAEGETHVSEEELMHPQESDLPPLTLLGFIGMIDPLRPEAKESVEKCQQAGIQVAMVTGDHPATALAIAKELGIAHAREDVITGQQLSQICALEMTQCIEKIKSVRVFARVSPLQKLDIVETLIRQGHFVAVTGDGVNDAPALRKANIGVAMGSGSDITKEISSIIVANDNFATIEAGVEEGRFAYANVRKVIWFLISNGTAEITLFMLAILLNLPLPLLPVQILWANLVTSGVQDIGLAFEKGEAEVMKRPPYKPTESIFNRPMIIQTLVPGMTMGLVCFSVFYWFLKSGSDPMHVRNITLLTLVLLENYNAFNSRSEYRSVLEVPIRNNYFLVISVIIAHLLHISAMNIPLLQEILGLTPVSFTEWLQLALLASSVLFAVEFFKRIRKRPEYHEALLP